MSTRWEHFSHEADMGLRDHGDTLARKVVRLEPRLCIKG